jgi:ElaB/YqjD/DUF883 family membrane-anchored ribosome-binding protein
MAKTRIDLPTQLPESFQRPLYAGVGVTDRVVEAVRGYVADVQKRALAVQKDMQQTVAKIDYQPQALREQATKLVTIRVENLNADAASGRKAVEERMAALQADAKALPARLQKLLDEQVATAGDTYEELVKRGESLVGRVRRQASTQETLSSATTTVTKAKTTKTQAAKATKSARTTAKKSPAKSSAKATATAAAKTASSAARAATDAAEKIGD